MRTRDHVYLLAKTKILDAIRDVTSMSFKGVKYEHDVMDL